MSKQDQKEIEKIKKEKIKKFKEHPMTQKIGTNYSKCWTILTLAQLGTLIISISLTWDTVFLIGIQLIAAVALLILFKDGAPINQKEKTKNYVTIIFILTTLNLINYFLNVGVIPLIPEIPAYQAIIIGLRIFINIMTVGFSIALLNSNKFIELLNEIAEKSFFDSLLGEDIKSGDAILGINAETNKPIILPFSDRFLHVLALGATGTGKTSMTLTPMAWRDINDENMGLTCIEPKGDFAEQIWAMAKIANRECIFFDPIALDCPFFNPLYGPENDVIENMATTFRMLGNDSSSYFQDAGETLLRNALKVLKRWEQRHSNGREVTLIDLSSLLHGSEVGVKILDEFSKIKTRNEDEANDHYEVYRWFKNEYFGGNDKGNNNATKSYEATSAIRTQLTKINSNQYLRRVLNPTSEDKDKPRIDFAHALENRQILAISTCQGTLQDLSTYLGYFIILSFQASVFNRPGNVDTRPPHTLIIDEFQSYANMKFATMLTQGRSYKVSSVLATQNRSLIGANAGKDAKNFVDLVSTNARNVVIYPGANYDDANYYSRQFGEILERKVERGISRPVASPIYGLDGFKRPNESIREVEKKVARFTPTDITYRDFGEATVGIIKNNTIQFPVVAKLSFIDRSIKIQMDKLIEDYVEEQRDWDISNLDKYNEEAKKNKKNQESEAEMFENAREEAIGIDIIIDSQAELNESYNDGF